MKTVKIEHNYVLNDEKIVSVEIEPVSFVRFVDLLDKARTAAQQSADMSIQAALRRERFYSQVTFISEKKKQKIDAVNLSLMPAPVAKSIIAHLGEEEGEVSAGEVLSAGDGVSTPILYKLGTPIKGADGKELTELEFIAKTYPDIEEVLVEDDRSQQTLLLIQKVAKPIGMLQIPSWALDQITLADGLNIAAKVLPSFAE